MSSLPPPFLGLREGLRRFLRLRPTEVTARPAEPAGRAGSEAAPRARLAAGQFGLIGLEDLRAELGPRWGALEERVRLLAEAVIRRHLVRGDLFEVQADGSYVILFSTLSEEAARFKCRVIGREITDKLLGSDSPRLADVSSVSAMVNAQDLRRDDPEALLARAFATGDRHITSDPDAPRLVKPGPERLAHAEESEAFTPSPKSTGNGPQWRPMASRSASGHEAAAIISTVSPPDRIEAARFRYDPVWDFKTQSLIRFRLSGDDRQTAEEPATGPEAHLARGLASLRHVLADMSVLAAFDRRAIFICVIDESCIYGRRERDELLALIRTAPLDVRRLLILEIFLTGSSVGLALSRFIEAAAALGLRCSAGAILAHRAPVDLTDVRLITAAVDLRGVASESEAMPRLARFAQRCSDRRIQSAAHGLGSRSLVLAAVASGIRYLSGPAVHPAVEDPGAGLRFAATDLYRDLADGLA